MMYQEERTSNAAVWCERFAVFLIPYFLLVIALYRFSKIETVQLYALVGIGLLIALLSIFLAIRSAVELWAEGMRGGSRLVRGATIALLVLMPFLYFGFLAVQLPLANDVSTSPFDPPEYVAAIDYREARADKGMNPVFEYSREYAQGIVAAYPGLQTRRYPAGQDRVYQAVIEIIRNNEWPITASEGIPEIAQPNEAADPSQLAGGEDEPIATDGEGEALEGAEPEEITIEFVQRTLLFGFENDVVVRIVTEAESTLVDLRSSSRWGRHDFGHNTTLIEGFLANLDEALLGIAGEG